MTEFGQNSILRMSDEKTMELIDLYHKETCLWNTHLESYKNRYKRAQAADRIARKLNIKNFGPHHVVIKFKNLRNSYSQELKKIAASLNSRLANEEVYKPKVIWFNKMDSFLRPHLQTQLPMIKQGAYETSKDHCVIKEEPSEDTEEWAEITNPEDLLQESVDQEQYSEPEEPIEPVPPKRQRISKKRERSDVGSLASTLGLISSRLDLLTSQRDDHFDSFGKYIASLLRSMPVKRAMSLQPQIVSLITSPECNSVHGQVSQSDDKICDILHCT